MAAVSGLRSIELAVPDTSAAADFYARVWGLYLVAEDEDRMYFRGTGDDHHILALHGGNRRFVRVNLRAETPEDVDALHESLVRAGAPGAIAPALISEPGDGYACAFTDFDGREFRIVAGVRAHDALPPADGPKMLSHVVLNSRHTAANSELFTGVLGFRKRDETRSMDFLGCTPYHHSIAFTRHPDASVNHIAFDLETIDQLMRGSARLKKHAFDVQWGVGRHGPGANIFAYFIDPHEFVVEYTTDMARVSDADYVPGNPEIWGKRGAALDAWGLAEPPTERMRTAMLPAPAR